MPARRRSWKRRLADARLTLDREFSGPGDAYPQPDEPAAGAGRFAAARYSAPGYVPADSYPAFGPAGAHDTFGAATGSDALGRAETRDYGRASGVDAGGLDDPGLSVSESDRARSYEEAGGFGTAYDPPFDPAAGDRTEVLLRRGRAGAAPRLSRTRRLVLAGAAGTILLIILILVLTAGSASWPPSVAVVESQAAVACRNPDVRSEPGQVNFACAKATRQILWVFALLTSRDNPSFKDARTGRVGLEPISAAQGGAAGLVAEPAPPVHPSNPVDSLEVAARAINNIIGGATVTSAAGRPVVQSGLESSAANCLRYTGSAAMTSPVPASRCTVRQAGHDGRRARPRWSLTSTRSGSSGRTAARRRTRRVLFAELERTRAIRRSRPSSGALPAQRPADSQRPAPVRAAPARSATGREVDS